MVVCVRLYPTLSSNVRNKKLKIIGFSVFKFFMAHCLEMDSLCLVWNIEFREDQQILELKANCRHFLAMGGAHYFEEGNVQLDAKHECKDSIVFQVIHIYMFMFIFDVISFSYITVTIML
jgi:hypothetical protein